MIISSDKKWRLATGILLALLVTAALPAQSGTGIPWLTDTDAAIAQAQATGQRVLVVVTGGVWCDPCGWFEEHTLSDPAIQALISGSWVALRLSDADPATAPWNIDIVPTVLFLDSAGAEIERIRGGVTVATLVSRITALPSTSGQAVSSGTSQSGTVFRVGATGTIWNDGRGGWYTQDAGLPPRLEEYDRDETFLYLRDQASATVLAFPLTGNPDERSLWQWDRSANDWSEVGPLLPQ